MQLRLVFLFVAALAPTAAIGACKDLGPAVVPPPPHSTEVPLTACGQATACGECVSSAPVGSCAWSGTATAGTCVARTPDAGGPDATPPFRRNQRECSAP